MQLINGLLLITDYSTALSHIVKAADDKEEAEVFENQETSSSSSSQDLLADIFEIIRRYKILNPEKLRYLW